MLVLLGMKGISWWETISWCSSDLMVPFRDDSAPLSIAAKKSIPEAQSRTASQQLHNNTLPRQPSQAKTAITRREQCD